jgi:phage shock protein C
MNSSPRSPLTRSHSDKKLGGVAGGLGASFGVDPLVFRVGFAVATLFSGFGALVYLVMLAVMPTDELAVVPVGA